MLFFFVYIMTPHPLPTSLTFLTSVFLSLIKVRSTTTRRRITRTKESDGESTNGGESTGDDDLTTTTTRRKNDDEEIEQPETLERLFQF